MERKFEKNGILRGAAWLTFSVIFVKFMGLVYKVPLAYILTDEGMGYFNAAYTIYSLLYLLGTAGVPKAITVLISGTVTDMQREKQKIHLISCRFFLLLGLLLFFLLSILSKPISHWIGSPDAYPTLLLISPCLLFSVLGGVYRGYLTAEEDFASIAIASVIEACAKLLLGLAFVGLARLLQMSLPWRCAFAVLGIGIGALLSTLYLRVNIKKENTGYKLRQFAKSERRKVIKKILHIAIPITLGSLAAGLSSLIDLSMIMKRLILGGYTVKAATAAYGNYTTLAVPMLQLANTLLVPITVVLLPRLAAAFANGERNDCASTLHLGGEICAFFAAPMAVAFFFLPQYILSLLFPLKSAESAAPLLRILSVGVLFMSVLIVLNCALEAGGEARLQMLSMLAGIAAKIPISYFLIANPEYGIAGAPIGTVVSYAVSLVFSYACFSKIHGSSAKIFSSYRLPLMNSFLSILCVFFTSALFRHASVSRVQSLVLVCVYGVVYLIFSYLTGVLRPEKIINMAKNTKNSI